MKLEIGGIKQEVARIYLSFAHLRFQLLEAPISISLSAYDPTTGCMLLLSQCADIPQNGNSGLTEFDWNTL